MVGMFVRAGRSSIYQRFPGKRSSLFRHDSGDRHRTQVHAGFDDLTFASGVLAIVLGVIPPVAILGLAIGLLGVVFALAARQSSRNREEFDHPARMWWGLGLSIIAVGLGLFQAFQGVLGVLHMLHH